MLYQHIENPERTKYLSQVLRFGATLLTILCCRSVVAVSAEWKEECVGRSMFQLPPDVEVAGHAYREIANEMQGGKPTFKAQHCRRYDERDNVVLWVSPKHTNKCPAGEPSLRDEWRKFKYAMFKGKQVQLLSRWHIPKGETEWKEEWVPIQLGAYPEAVSGNAYVDSRRGVREIFGSNYGKLDNNAANTVVDGSGHWRGSNYYFPKQIVPASVLENPDELYKYERRRVTNLDSHTRMAELFKPNEHISRHRFYMTEDYVLRHEQLNAQGKVTRIITVNDWRQPRPGPNPDINDNLLSTSVRGLAGHRIYH